MGNTNSTSRSLCIDALRGLALFGILAVNIQSFVWGLSGPTLGLLNASSTSADRATLFLTALLLEYKAYPIFCFCFGYGFAVQTQLWISKGENAASRFAGRLRIMFLLGAVHGVFLYFGDILSRYALAGFILRRHIGKSVRELKSAILFWLVVVIVISLLSAFLVAFASFGAASASQSIAQKAEAIQLAQLSQPKEISQFFTIYTTGTYLDITQQRWQDYWQITLGFVFYMPQLILLFLLGAFTAKMKWLKYPRQHLRLWKKIFFVALLVGVPLNIFYALGAVDQALMPSTAPSLTQTLASSFIPILAGAYIAMVALFSTTAIGKRLLALFASAGKIALTNYLMQSMMMTTLLYGYGLALGRDLTQFQLLQIAISIYIAQLFLSQLYLKHFSIGPMEWLWRKLS